MMVPKLSQAELSDKLGVSFPADSEIREGRQPHERGHDGADRGGTKSRRPVFLR